MISNDTLIEVTNRYPGTVGYTIPDLDNLHRNFQVRETKELPMIELRKLSFIPGGIVTIKDCLIINNDEAIKELLGETEPEYFYTEEDIKKLLTEGTMDQFMDCLEFAPEGVIEIIKDLAVKLEVSDIRKRDAILQKTGFNVTNAIRIEHESSEVEKEEVKKVRRSTPINSESKERRTAPPRYKVIEK